MIDYKAGSLISMKKMLQAGKQGEEKRFLASLTPVENNIYKTALSVSWVSIKETVQLLEKGAEVLFPGDPGGMEYIGHEQALDELQGIYKIFLKMTTVPYLMNQSAKLWRNYFKKGQARVEGNPEEKAGAFIIEDFPKLPEVMQSLVSGYLAGALELTGAKNVQVTLDPSDPQIWRWNIEWE